MELDRHESWDRSLASPKASCCRREAWGVLRFGAQSDLLALELVWGVHGGIHMSSDLKIRNKVVWVLDG